VGNAFPTVNVTDCPQVGDDARGTVAHGRVRRDGVVAYLTGRNEREIIAYPETVDVISVRPARVALAS